MLTEEETQFKISEEERKIIEIYRLPYFCYGNMIVYKREGKLSGAIEVHATFK